MAEAMVVTEPQSAEDVGIARIYEIGYHIVPTVTEEDLDRVVGEIRTAIEKAGGSFIAEGAPALTRLSYAMSVSEQARKAEYDRGYFGWIKFETLVSAIPGLEAALKANRNILRSILFQTVREDTRAKVKLATLREVRRTDTIKPVTRRVEESSAPVSEEDLEKALKDITTE